MKKLDSFVFALLLAGGICSVNAQDIIILKNGNEIQAKVLEISSTEIKYKRFDNLDGPMLILSAVSVSAIKYENGAWEDINAATKEAEAANKEAAKQSYPMNPDKFIFGIYANPIGFLILGPMAGFEFTKGRFNAEVNFRFPSLGLLMPVFEDTEYENKITKGIGVGLGLRYFLPAHFGGYYFGGFVEYGSYIAVYGGGFGVAKPLIIAASGGWKFVTKSNIYFRVGGYFGVSFNFYEWHSNSGGGDDDIYILPVGFLDAAIGFNFGNRK